MAAGEIEAQVVRFLQRAREAQLSVGVREHLDVRHVVDALCVRGTLDDAALRELRQRLSALLARDAAELRCARQVFDEAFGVPGGVDNSGTGPTVVSPPPPECCTLSARARVLHAGALLMVTGLPAVRPRFAPEDEVGPVPPIIVDPPAHPPAQPEQGTWEVVRDSTSVQASGFEPRAPELADVAGFVLAFVLALLAAHLWRLPALGLALGEQRRQRAEVEYKRLSAEAAARGEPLTFSYAVPRHVPLPGAALDDIATLLARVHRPQAGHELDVQGTIDATMRQGGRFVPVMARSTLPSELLVLVDTEGAGHPWLPGMELTLDALVARGVRLRRYRFDRRPHLLWRESNGERVSLQQLSAAHRGACLLLLSRKLQPWVLDDTQAITLAPWVAHLSRFDRCAWLDPDPRAADERRAQELRELARRGLPRYPFSVAGWEAVARWFALPVGTFAAPPAPVSWPLLPALSEVDAAVRAWALTAAMVPDASWEQLEAVRRDGNRFPEVGKRLDEWHHLQCLLSWVAQRPGMREGFDTGPSLKLPPQVEQALVAADSELSALDQEPLRLRARKLWLRQLRDAVPPRASLAHWRWRLKCCVHELHLGECGADKAVAEFVAAPIAEEARGVLSQELAQLALGDDARARAAARGLRPLRAFWGDGHVTRGDLGFRGMGWADLRRLALSVFGALVLSSAVLVAGQRGSLAGFWAQTPVAYSLVLPEVQGYRVTGNAPSAPEWAEQSGTDEYGRWATFAIGDVRVKMREIPAGTFTMGSPESEEERFGDEAEHQVTLTASYWLAETETTQALWQVVMGGNPSNFKDSQRPVEQVSWNEAQAFLTKLNAREPGLEARLPTEAEWEYACRAGTTTARYGELDAIAWYSANSSHQTHPVGQREPNAWGLYDTLGNVNEWCEDWYDDYGPQAVTNPPGPEVGSRRVLRGGSWGDNARIVRVAFRHGSTPEDRGNFIGFRLARGTGAP